MRGMGGLALQLLLGASGVLAAGALAKGVDFSTDGHGHEFVTYLAWYGAGAIFVIATVVLSIAIYKRREATESLETPHPCGEPRVRLKKLKNSAKHLKWELEHFDNRWPAVENEDFDGELPDGRQETHAEAMQALQWAFAFYFSASWTYENKCQSHHGRRQRRLLKRLEAVYNALGLNPGSNMDAPLNSGQLHIIGERSTKRWGEPEAEPVSEADFGAELIENQELTDCLEPVRRLLLTAAPGTDAHSRLKEAEKAVNRVKRKLIYCYRL